MRLMIVAIFFSAFPSLGLGAPIRVDWSAGEFGARLYLQCTFGKCLIDTGGRGNLIGPNDRGSLLTVDKKTVNFVSGPESCDVLAPTKIQLAEREIDSVTFTSCNGQSSSLGPTLGLPVLENSRFQLTSSNPVEGFKWLDSKSTLPGKIIRHDDWLWIPVQLGETAVEAMFDTGAPVTLVDETFFNAHPELFDETAIPSPLPTGRIIYLKQPLSISGKEFNSRTAMVLDLHRSLGLSAPSIILGLNHILRGEWTIDLVQNSFDLH
jgi:hypothetical protein